MQRLEGWIWREDTQRDPSPVRHHGISVRDALEDVRQVELKQAYISLVEARNQIVSAGLIEEHVEGGPNEAIIDGKKSNGSTWLAIVAHDLREQGVLHARKVEHN